MFPRWLSWLVLACIAYLMVTGTRKPPHSPAPSVVAEAPAPAAGTAPNAVSGEAAASYPSLTAATDVERWKRALNPTYAERDRKCILQPAGHDDAPSLGFKRIDETPGEGAAAACGDTIRITLIVWSGKGTPAYEATVELVLGEHAIATGLDAGLVGIRPGGVRTLVMPPAALDRNAHATTTPAALLAALPATRTALVTATRVAEVTAP